MSTVRKSTTTTVVRPAGRYFKNKAPRGAADAASDSSDEEEEEEDVGEDDDATAGDLLAQRGTAAGQPRKEMDVKLGKMGVTSEGKVTGGKTEGEYANMRSNATASVRARVAEPPSLHAQSQARRRRRAQMKRKRKTLSPSSGCLRSPGFQLLLLATA